MQNERFARLSRTRSRGPVRFVLVHGVLDWAPAPPCSLRS
jgi:hypothetical protein